LHAGEATLGKLLAPRQRRNACSAVCDWRALPFLERLQRAILVHFGVGTDHRQMSSHRRNGHRHTGSGRRNVGHAGDNNQSRLHMDSNRECRLDRDYLEGCGSGKR